MTDRDDATGPTSSEDLIRQARQAYEPPPDSATSGGLETPQPTAPVSRDRQPAAPTPVETGGPADYVRPEFQGTPQPAVPDGGVTYQAQRPSFFSRFGGLLVVGVVIVGFVLFNMFDKTKQVDELAVGDCLLMPASEEITSVESTECSASHELEVFALVTLTDGPSVPYPGENPVANSIFEQCIPHFEGYVGASFETSIWWVNAIYPTQESWEDSDDRAGTCVLYQPGNDDDPLTVTRSARNSAE